MARNDLILIIGNGRSVLDYSFGEQINKFSVVGRINNYSTKKNENFYKWFSDGVMNTCYNAVDKNILEGRLFIRKEDSKLILVDIIKRKYNAYDFFKNTELGIVKKRK